MTLKDYASACRFPTLRMGGMPVPRLILGHLPFVGESYQGADRNAEYATRFSDVGNTVKILRLAVEGFGLTVMAAGMMANSDRLSTLFFEAIKEVERVTKTEIALIPCVGIPLKVREKPIDVYRRWMTYYELERPAAGESLARKYMDDPILGCRGNWRFDFERSLKGLRPYGADEIRGLQLDEGQLEGAISAVGGFKVLFLELGSETDFLAMTGRLDLLGKLVDHLSDAFGHRVILGTHHAGSTIPALEGSGLRFDGYVTPINELGIMMFPSTESAISSVRCSRHPVIAIKPLGGGRIEPRTALGYVFGKAGIDFCMIGVGSEDEARKDLSIALEVLKGNRRP